VVPRTGPHGRGPPSASAAETRTGAPQGVACSTGLGRREPAFRWLPPLASTGVGTREEEEDKEAKSGDKGCTRPQSWGRPSAGERAKWQCRKQLGQRQRGRQGSLRHCALPGPAPELTLGCSGGKGEGGAGGENGEEQAWQEVRAVCDEGAVLAWRLIGQQLLRAGAEGRLPHPQPGGLLRKVTALSSCLSLFVFFFSSSST